jgi:hypothetical protein
MEKVTIEQSTMDKSLTKEMVQNHWRYNEKIVDLSFQNREMLTKTEAKSLMKYFYISAMIHGIKHGVEGRLHENQEK